MSSSSLLFTPSSHLLAPSEPSLSYTYVSNRRPGVWIIGNLGRPGYGGTTDSVWPYTCDSYDVGTFPNQTLKNDSGPAAALHLDASKEKGSAVQQAVSSVKILPADMFEGSANNFIPSGFITWQSDGQQAARLGAMAVWPDTDPTVGSVLLPKLTLYTKSIVLNLGISVNWQTIDLTTMEFPAEIIEYVRVYQWKGKTNIGCDLPDYPTAKYIQDHLDTYSSCF
ncbi:glycoside hydrolase family 16 protein [Piloderma croceum F 1598]|uniref:Glycoside hydrolase family 16 protein n=1 Tax=Piloderma croceum (strain F 1598) TaxID=765440 RepID=A0A0C3EJJ8_PILCF|nr:glycoside hydrolase family 16 protein [Piloderma croceum F 1598]